MIISTVDENVKCDTFKIQSYVRIRHQGGTIQASNEYETRYEKFYIRNILIQIELVSLPLRSLKPLKSGKLIDIQSLM